MLYLDSSASTPILKEVIEEMKPFIEGHFSNASSKHKCADIVKSAIDLARERVSNVINSNAEEVIFTSGATESINLAIKGIITDYSDSHIYNPSRFPFFLKNSLMVIPLSL
jgi:cysteine desulfurase